MVISHPTLTEGPVKATESTNSRLTHSPVLSGVIDPDFIKSANKGGGPGAEIDGNTPTGTCGGSIFLIYQTHSKGGSLPELEANALAGTRRIGSNSTLTDITVKEIKFPNSRITPLPVQWVIDPDFIKKPLKGDGARTRG